MSRYAGFARYERRQTEFRNWLTLVGFTAITMSVGVAIGWHGRDVMLDEPTPPVSFQGPSVDDNSREVEELLKRWQERDTAARFGTVET